MSCNCNMNRAVNRNLTIAEDLFANNSTSVVKEVLIGGRGKKVVERRTRTCAIHLPHRFGNLFQKTRLL